MNQLLRTPERRLSDWGAYRGLKSSPQVVPNSSIPTFNQVKRAKAFDSESAVGHTGHVFAHGFVSCDRTALAQLQTSLVGVQTISSKGEDEASERLLGVYASARLGSDPLQCNLDGDYQSGPPRFVGKISQADHRVAWLHKKQDEPQALQARAWIWHAELNEAAACDCDPHHPRLDFMYEPLRASVVAGLKSHLHAKRWNVSSHVIADAEFFDVVSSFERRRAGEDQRLLERRLQPLRAGDLFVWIGEGWEGAVPVDVLRTRGVHTVYYQTEPVRGCRIGALTKRFGMHRYDEVWDYSRFNLDRCRQIHRNLTTFRYVPPVALPGQISAQQQSEETRLLFLGTARHRTGCVQSLGPKQRPVGCNQTCADALYASEGAGWLRTVSNAWNQRRMRGVLQTHGIFMNIHKACTTFSNPVPPRVSMLLNAKALVISERCHGDDESEFEGMVSFVQFAHIQREFFRLRAMSRAERQQLADARASAFRTRFDPRRVFLEAGVHTLLNQLYSTRTTGR